ncbi:MAG TPA: hypothetical protein VJ654_20340 [Noviherbaspirillum sp.]|nr:hypothetical protein [Noviherbaspirillum sp.]
MADPFRCISALNKAAGKELSPEELQDTFDRIQKTARDIAAGRIKPEGAPNLSSPEGIMQKAAEIAANELIHEKIRQQRNIHLRIAILGERKADVAAMKGGGIRDVDAVRRLIANDPDGRADRFSLEARVLGVSNLLKSRIQDTWAALGNDFLGFIQQTDKIRDLITEMKGQDSGNALAKKGAEAWAKAAEEARQWFNDKGGEIGHLDDWGFPQHHAQELVAKAGIDQWIADVYPALNHERYVDLAGNAMDEAQIKDLLRNAWWSIATSGANKIEPGKARGYGQRANRHAEERYIHFKDAEAVLGYWAKYGEKTFPDILVGHLEQMAKDIAFLEHFGPNPDATFRVLRDEAEQAAKLAEPTGIDKIEKELAQLDNLYDYAAGRTKPVANRSVAGMFDALRNLNAAGKLGSAFWASFYGDKVMLEAMGRVNKLPMWQSWFNELRLLNPFNEAERRQLQRQTLMLDYMRSAMYRFGDDLGRSSWTGKMSNAVMKLSGMSAINEWRRGAFGLTMMDAIGHEVSSKDFSQIGKQDMRLLTSFGITEHDWRIWKLAELEDYGHGNTTMLTPEGIAKITDDKLRAAGVIAADAGPEIAERVRREAVVKYLGALHSESLNAVIEPGWKERAMMVGGLQRGNIRDELMRSFWQFKAFPITQFERMWDIAASRPGAGGKAQFLSAVMLMTTAAGAMMLQTQSLLSGQDPRPMDDWKFWLAAFIKGGSLGIYGDFLYSQSATTRYGSGPLEVLAGPTIGSAATAVTALVQAGNAMSEGKDTHLPAKLLNIAKGYIPAQNLWYTRAATDHIIFQNAQEMLSPGYLANMRASSLRQFKQDWWWSPGEFLPDRAPDMANAMGH